MRSFTELLAAPATHDAGFVPAHASLSAELLEQTEVIGLREMHALALNLQRRKSERHAMLGRALAKAVRGEPFAPEGQRNGLTFQLAGEIIEEFPFCDPRSVLGLFSAALSLQGEPTLEGFARQLTYHQGRKQGKADTLRTLESTLLGQAPIGVPMHAPEVAPVPGQPAEQQRTLKDVIVKADGIYYLRHPSQDVYALKLKDDAALRLELINQFGMGNNLLNLIDTAGRMYPTENIMQWYGCNAHTIEKNFAVDATRFIFSEARLLIGHQMIPRELAAFDEATHNWLEHLSGGAEFVDELYDWIAATDQRHAGHPSAALAVIAKGDTGKSLFARLLAQTWGALPVKLDNAVQQFNGSLTRCPIWHADEEMPKELTGHEFRDLVASRDRLIEPKGQEKVLLLGSPRLVITVNELADIRIRGANGPDAVKAIADRLAIFTPTLETDAALRALEVPGQHGDVDTQRMIAHLRWIQCEIEPRGQRFLGARSDRSQAELPVLQAVMYDLPQLFELLENYLVKPQEIERAYHVEERTFSTGGQRFPIATQKGELYVRPTELAQRLNVDPYRIDRALQPFRDGKVLHEISFGNKNFRGRFWRLNLDRLIAATGAEIEAACNTVSCDTRDRNPQFA
ncbi:MAG: hypothetical protein JWM16_6286 [Verrucomicrobiales bacterium]|nr:hypothetical protein [Verrucomicrobiales bacterium]